MSRWVEIFHILFSPVWLDRYSTMDFTINVYLIIILLLPLFDYKYYFKFHTFKKKWVVYITTFYVNYLIYVHWSTNETKPLFDKTLSFQTFQIFLICTDLSVSSWHSLTNYNNIPTTKSLSSTYPLIFFLFLYTFIFYFFIYYSVHFMV